MVFPGRFSSGCLRCRQRKVKCDEGKPTCRRCYNYGKPCLGYTDEFHFRHSAPKGRSQSTSSNTSRASKAPSIASASTASPPQDEKPPEKEPPKPKTRPLEAPIRRRSVAMVRHPTQSYDNMSLCYFVRRFVSPDDDDGFPGHFSFLPSLFDHYKDGLVETATLSVAQLAAYNHLGNEELRTRSLRNYGRVIKGLQQTIQSDDQAMDDKVIATILLLCTYKDFSGEGLGDPNEHASGLFYLLEKRGPSQIGTRRGAELFLLALLRLQIYSFLHGDDAYTDPGAIATVIGIFDPLLRALSMMGRTLSLRHRLCRLMQSETYQPQGASPSTASQSSTGTEDERILIQECFDMLDAFGSWDIEAAEYWQLTFEGRGVPTTLGEMSAGKMHYDAETACIIILVRSARLILLQTMLLYQTTLLPTEDDDGYSYNSWAETVPFLESDVRKTVDDMLAAVPYALGDIDPSGMPATMLHDGAAAIIIVHSIRLVTHCVYTTPEQTERAARILARLNSAIGIRSAVGFVPGGDNYGVQPFQALSPSPMMMSPGHMDCTEENFVSPGALGLLSS
ncbi:Sterol uptake control protein 2 [Fusarium oxysporum f. sp. cubense race 1]|uniref:Sterol uptake control protein 2 n=1 Tax=Fusarium oxysporum f. sp. cubense (strain race 1) TaxID=1229664 RepID=N4U7S1_FUSC1|nr:Sterol uptake control protein 2 [Fusarium oxysporum f. sp. cubense race 1]